PHCGTSTSCHAICSGCVPSADSPSSVVTCLLATVETGVWQERMARPSRCTVHAPHSPAPQPNLVPFRLRTSRINPEQQHVRGDIDGRGLSVDSERESHVETPQLGRAIEPLV